MGARALGSPACSVSRSSARRNAMPWPIAVKSLMRALDAIPMSAATASASTFHGRFGATHSSSVAGHGTPMRSEEHTSELQSLAYLVCRLLLEKKKKKNITEQLSLTDQESID